MLCMRAWVQLPWSWKAFIKNNCKKKVDGRVKAELLDKKGIIVLSNSMSGLSEEAPIAYKDVADILILLKSWPFKESCQMAPLGL